jgi:hypothetical protein
MIPGRRMKFDTRDLYAFGVHRGAIDERWLASTTQPLNENMSANEGLSYVVSEGERFLFKDAIAAVGERLIGKSMWNAYKRWPSTVSSLTTWGRCPITCTSVRSRQSWHFSNQLSRSKDRTGHLHEAPSCVYPYVKCSNVHL